MYSNLTDPQGGARPRNVREWAMVFMLDTCVINRILDGRIGNEWSLRGDNFVTDIQLQEILDTKTRHAGALCFTG